ncbi:MAG TPA: tagaturonate reductase [Arachidicoccus sp.]|nr:tagaturonate reductase [Arachidicoccus sp.]
MQDTLQARPQLSKSSLPLIKNITTPQVSIMDLPEKVLQFGTGVLLRGLPDYYIDKANKMGAFNGRIVVVKSTSQNRADEFSEQDGLYTLCMRGWQNGQSFAQDIINCSISRVIDANANWKEVIKCAANPEMKIIFSNTTEVGIQLDKEDKISATEPPRSFPGKLVSFLYERFKIFEGDPGMGMVIVPTELIADNGRTLEAICLELAKIADLEPAFILWLEKSNEFCDSLVDRIVAGKMQEAEAAEVEGQLGYKDKLMIMSEVYGLWAIETESKDAAAVLSFDIADSGVIVTPNIEKYRHLKLFLLNAPHTFTCVLAQAVGFQFVNEAMADKDFNNFISHLLMEEAVPAVVNADTTKEEAVSFARDVLDRFRNPYINHQWSDISKQMTLKMVMRCIPLIQAYREKFDALPPFMIRGFAAYLLFLKTKSEGSENYSSLNGHQFKVTDAKSATLQKHWQSADTVTAVKNILSDRQLWQMDLTGIPLLEQTVIKAVLELEQRITLNF